MNKLYKTSLTIMMLFISFLAKAQDVVKIDAESSARYEQDYSYYLMYLFLLATILGFIYAAYRIFYTKENKTEVSALDKMLYDTVAVEREDEIMTNHEYDGIKELDNHLPPWWVWLMYLTIIFAVIYSGYYFTGMGMSQEEEYADELLYAKYQQDLIQKDMNLRFDETNVAVITDAAKIQEGKEIYETNCVLCHLKDGGGNVGPNLTDKFYIHGKTSTEMYEVIRDGVLSKGMLSWKKQLNPFQIQNVMSYIKTELEGTTPEKPKEAQGEEIVE